MAAPSTYTWKREAPWSDRNCDRCGRPVALKHGVIVNSTRRAIRHLGCGRTSKPFLSCGNCDYCLLAEAAVGDAHDHHRDAA